MIKNVAAPLFRAVLALGLVAGCAGKGEPAGWQGVVELDERQLGFEVGGRVQQVKVDEGDPVAPGMLLAALDDSVERGSRVIREQEAAAAEAQSALTREGPRSEEIRSMADEVAAARAEEELYHTNLEREQRLFDKGASTAAQVDELSSRYRAASARRRSLDSRLRELQKGSRAQEVETARAKASAAASAVDLASARLRMYELRALEPGTVLAVNAEPGEVVAAGTPVLTVADIRHPYADVFVPQGKLAGIDVGGAAQVRVDSIASPLPGHVEYISRRTEFTPRYLFSEGERANLVVRVRVRIEDPEELLHAGVPAFVTFPAAPAVAAGAR